MIELIVVVAIIAVLAAVVSVSVVGYLNKGKDAAAKAQLSGLSTQATVFYDNNNTYTGVCSDTAVAAFLTGIDNSIGTLKRDCNDSATAWAACHQLLSKDYYFCADSTGVKKEIATKTTCVAAWAAAVCP